MATSPVVKRPAALSLVLSSVLVPAVAAADTARPVIGGSDAPAGKYPDIVGVMFDYGNFDSVDCTGTLIAPDLVITAGHCVDDSLTRVLIGSTSRSRVEDGEVIDVVERLEYPSSWTTYDVAVLRLARASVKTPRPIARGWARFDIVDGATVALVGFGAVDQWGSETVDRLQEAMTSITDADCSQMPGCNAGARPAGELGAGGSGIDTCPGDSGGPAYLVTEYGTFLAGVTSRAYNDATRACSDGGIYVRPDAVVAWIEEQMGVALPPGPGPGAEVLVAEVGGNGRARVEPNDPRAGAAHTFRIVTAPAHGTAEIAADGTVTYQAGAEYLGTDAIEIEVADAADPTRALTFTMDVEVVEQVDAGCCSAGGGGAPGAAAVALVALAALGRRRRC